MSQLKSLVERQDRNASEASGKNGRSLEPNQRWTNAASLRLVELKELRVTSPIIFKNDTEGRVLFSL